MWCIDRAKLFLFFYKVIVYILVVIRIILLLIHLTINSPNISRNCNDFCCLVLYLLGENSALPSSFRYKNVCSSSWLSNQPVTFCPEKPVMVLFQMSLLKCTSVPLQPCFPCSLCCWVPKNG